MTPTVTLNNGVRITPPEEAIAGVRTPIDLHPAMPRVFEQTIESAGAQG